MPPELKYEWAYRQLRDRIVRAQQSGVGALPRESELAAELGIGRITLRTALKRLEEERLVRRIRGKGTVLRQDASGWQERARGRRLLLVRRDESQDTSGFFIQEGAPVRCRELGVPEDRLLIEDAAANTGENFSFSKKLLAEKGIRKPYILMIGGTEPRKNVVFAANAYLSSSACQDHDLVILGDEWCGYPFPDRIKNHPQIHCLGKISEEDLNLLYANAKVFVFPSLYEGFGLPPFEAMSYGVPVIAANASCMPDLLNDCALLFQPGDCKDFLDKLDQMLHSEETRRKYTTLGADKVKQMTWNNTVYATTRIYQTLISRRKKR